MAQYNRPPKAKPPKVDEFISLFDRLILFLLFIYQKNEQENLSQMEKAELKQLADAIKKRIRNE